MIDLHPRRKDCRNWGRKRKDYEDRLKLQQLKLQQTHLKSVAAVPMAIGFGLICCILALTHYPNPSL